MSRSSMPVKDPPHPDIRVPGRLCSSLSKLNIHTSATGLFHKLPMLGKLFSFSGKSSLYRTGSARCSTTLRGMVPKTEANLLMHSDLRGLGREAGDG